VIEIKMEIDVRCLRLGVEREKGLEVGDYSYRND
jgi:hypothetical protein